MKKMYKPIKELIKNEESVSKFEEKVNRRKKNVEIKKQLKIYMISLILFLSSYIMYKISLTGCKKTEYECVSEERIKFFYKLGIITLISSVLYAILTKFLIKHKKWLSLLIYSLIYLFQVFSNKGEGMEHHGRFNMIGFFLFFSISFIILRILQSFYDQILQKKYKKLIIIFSIIFTTITTFLIVHRAACKGFNKGLGGYRLINNRSLDACYMGKPKTCDIPIYSKISLFDYSRFITSCKNRRNDKKKFIKYLNEINPNLTVPNNTYYFPNTNIFNYIESDWGNMYLSVFKNISGVKKKVLMINFG